MRRESISEERAVEERPSDVLITKRRLALYSGLTVVPILGLVVRFEFPTVEVNGGGQQSFLGIPIRVGGSVYSPVGKW